MNNLIACCGLDCADCDARRATINNDDDLRRKTAENWSKLYQTDIPPEAINCEGCRENGVKIAYCEKMCQIRACALKKGFSTCAECADLEGCATAGMIFKSVPQALTNLKSLRV